jgi:pimeloyl-ACP methyl ester carboxylesterase
MAEKMQGISPVVWVAVVVAACVTLITSFGFSLHFRQNGAWRKLPMYICAYCREWGYNLLSFCLYPFGFLPWSEPQSTEPAIVLLHGYSMNKSHMLVLLWRLRRAGFRNVRAVNLWPPLSSLHQIGQHTLRRLKTIPGPLTIVAHSMGGLVARHCAKEGAPIKQIITLGTPHAGTLMAAFGRGHNARDMRCDSKFLAELGDSRVPLTSIYSQLDNVIIPPHSAAFGSQVIEFDHCGHNTLVYDSQVFGAIVQALRTSG